MRISRRTSYLLKFRLSCFQALLLLLLSSASFANPVQSTKLVFAKAPQTIADVFAEIKKQTDFIVFYDNGLLDDAQKISITEKETSVENVMDRILKGTSLNYKISGNYILITQKNAPAHAASNNINIGAHNEIPADTVGPRKTVSGRVEGEDGSPLSGVSVMVVNINKGTTTNTKGEFKLSAGKGDAIKFTYVGKKDEIAIYRGESYLNIVMKNDSASQLQDVIVTGFQKIDKRKFTGAAAKVKMDEIKQDGVMDVSRMLEGRVAGVIVENVSGTFGAAPKIQIRGATSISGSNKPLWVVDGIVLEDIVNVTNDQLASGDPTTMLGSSVAGINTNDIETFDILRDASATALYGARAMNGVIVITTKKGKSGKVQMNYNGTFSSVLKPTYSKFNIMNSAQQMSVDMELGGNNFSKSQGKGWLNYSDMYTSPMGGVFTKAAHLMDYDETLGRFGLANDPDSISEYLRHYALINTNWFDVLYRNSFTQEHNISMSFGTEKAQSYFSANFYQDNGRTVGDHVDRYTTTFKNTYTPNSRLNIGFNVNASYRQQRAPGTVDRVANNVNGGYDRDFDINPFSYALNTSRIIPAYDENGNLEYVTKNFAPFNIVNELQNNTLNVNVLDVKAQVDLGYKITKAIKFDFTGAVRYVGSALEHEINENSNMAEAYRAAGTAYIRDNNKFLYHDPAFPDADPQVVLPKGGFYNRTDNKMLNWNIKTILTYNKEFNRDNSLNVLLGNELKTTDRQVNTFTGYGFQYNSGNIPFVDYRIMKQILEANFNYYGLTNAYDRFAAFFGKASYTYKRKYTVDGTARVDGSNSLGKSSKSRWLPTWTVSARWAVSAEPFMQNFASNLKMNNLTLRASYGLTADFGSANSSTAIFQSQTTKRPTLSENETGIALVSLENSDLTWEKKYEPNIGMDLGFFKDRLTFVIDAYSRRNFDLISFIPTAGIGGQLMKAINYADVKGKGIEFTVAGRIIQKKDFTWRGNLTFAYNTNKITKLRNQTQLNGLVSPQGGAALGYPTRAIFSIPFVGLDHETGIPVFSQAIENQDPNTLLQSTNVSTLKYEGSATPLYTGGLTNIITYKNLSLNILFVYQAGNKVRLNSVFSAQYSDLNAMPKDFIDRWEAPGDELKTNVPSISDQRMIYFLNTASPYSNYNMSDIRVARGGFVRLKTVAFTYTIPERYTKSIGLNTSSFTFTGNNLWLMFADSKLKGQDPEYANSGGVGSPVYTQLSLSLKVGF